MKINKKVFATLAILVLPLVALASVDSLGGQTGTTQIFTNDTNVTMTSDADTHTLGWAGFLSPSRGGLGTDASGWATGSIPFFDGSNFTESTNLSWDSTNSILRVSQIQGVNNEPINIYSSGDGVPASFVGSTGVVNNGGNVFIGAGVGTNGNAGGNIQIHGGQGDVASGGTVLITGGNSTGNPGDLDLNGGNNIGTNNGARLLLEGAFGINGYGGDGTFFGGYSTDGAGGDISIQGGEGILGNFAKIKVGGSGYGDIKFITAHDKNFIFNQGLSGNGLLDFHSITSIDRTFVFPDASGTISLLESTQEFSGVNTFSSPVTNFVNESNSTVHIGANGFPGCIVMGDSDNTGVTYITVKNGKINTSTTKPANCN